MGLFEKKKLNKNHINTIKYNSLKNFFKTNFFIFTIIFVFLWVSIYLYFKFTSNLEILHTKKEILKIKRKGTILKNLLNDYNIKFLPETNFIKISIKKIDLTKIIKTSKKNLNIPLYTFFIENYLDKKIFLLEKNGTLYFFPIEELNTNKINLVKIKTNLKIEHSLDLYIYNNLIYISGLYRDKNKLYMKLYRGSYDQKNEINFNEIFSSSDCPAINDNLNSGKIKKFKNNIILTSPNFWNDKINENNQNICGKVIEIDENNGSFKIYAKGIRNALGLYSDNKYILETENGPDGGDEINKIVFKGHYGWPWASYGEKYFKDKTGDTVDYLKNHEKHNFIEPIYSFIPSIGISEIIKLDNNFSKLWQDNFLIGSLYRKSLYRVKFDNDFNKLLYLEEIFIGDRIRDLLYVSPLKMIVLSLEHSGSLAIMKRIEK